MSAVMIDGVAAAKVLYAALAVRVQALKARGVTPGLATVLVGEDPASRVYVRNKIKACENLGMFSEHITLPATLTTAVLLQEVAALNARADIHGMIVQLPLPPQIDNAALLQAIAPDKDVDGFHWRNLGALTVGNPRLVPCTPAGILYLLDREGVAIEGARAVVIGRSLQVGKPAALLLIARGATVTVCHSKTVDLAAITREADILVAAVGRPRLVTAAMVKPGATVIDVGINRVEGKLVGDVDYEAVRAVAGRITPVPGGVGPMTVAMLIANTVAAAEQYAGGVST
ncbi:MAG: bifunctional 5,10-methylenetetrahydrofolate dehydrogenase/5,10-methenyltetrahydrofolate cyclohydrolase [Burkholderiales bacterium]